MKECRVHFRVDVPSKRLLCAAAKSKGIPLGSFLLWAGLEKANEMPGCGSFKNPATQIPELATDWSAVVMACAQMDQDPCALAAEVFGELARALHAVKGKATVEDILGADRWAEFVEACTAAGLDPQAMAAGALKLLAGRATRAVGGRKQG